MTSMIDKVAKAICNWQDSDNWEIVLARSPVDSTRLHAEHYRKMAIAAIKAMREPTYTMAVAGVEAAPFPYRAMIDAALKEIDDAKD